MPVSSRRLPEKDYQDGSNDKRAKSASKPTPAAASHDAATRPGPQILATANKQENSMKYALENVPAVGSLLTKGASCGGFRRQSQGTSDMYLFSA